MRREEQRLFEMGLWKYLDQGLRWEETQQVREGLMSFKGQDSLWPVITTVCMYVTSLVSTGYDLELWGKKVGEKDKKKKQNNQVPLTEQVIQLRH